MNWRKGQRDIVDLPDRFSSCARGIPRKAAGGAHLRGDLLRCRTELKTALLLVRITIAVNQPGRPVGDGPDASIPAAAGRPCPESIG